MNDRPPIRRVRDFLNSYKYAVNLDDKKFDRRFQKEKGRADFLLYGKKIVCELKEFQKIDIPAHVERVWKKENIKGEFIGTAVARSIHDELRNKAGTWWRQTTPRARARAHRANVRLAERWRIMANFSAFVMLDCYAIDLACPI